MPLLVYEIEHESLYATLAKQKLTDAPFRGFVHMTLKHRPPAKHRKGKKTFFLHRMLQTFGTNFGFASACSVASALFEFILDHFGGLDAYSLSMSGNTWPPV